MGQAGFTYQRPETLAGLVRLIKDLPPDGYRFMAGGTDLLPRVRQKATRADTIISLSGLPELSGISREGTTLVIGSGTTLEEVARSPLVREQVPALAQAAGQVAGPQIRNMGTIGGNVCLETRCLYFNQQHWAGGFAPCLKRGGAQCYQARAGKRCFALCRADTPAVLLAYDAALRLLGPAGERIVGVRDFYTDDGVSNRLTSPAEVVADIQIPLGASFGSYVRMSWRRAIDFPVVGLAVARGEGALPYGGLWLAATGLASRPVRLEALEELLADREESFVLGRDFEQAVAGIPVHHHADCPAAYRKRILTALLRSVLAGGPGRGGISNVPVS